MLVLSRYCDAEIRVGNDVTITVLEVHKGRVRLGIEAPSEISVRRGETPVANKSRPTFWESAIMFCKSAHAGLVAAALLMSVPASAQDWAGKMFQTSSHDFGVVARGEKAEFAFVLENLYVEDVHIAGVRASCHCTSPEIETETLKTHQKGAIIARFNTAAFLGSRGATLTVTFDRPYFAEVQLNVRGFIRSDLALQPGSVDFGTVDQGSAEERTVTVSHTGGPDWRITGVRSVDTQLSATATELNRSMR